MLKKFQTFGYNSWAGITRDNHLGSIFQKSPQKATNIMVELLAFQRGKTLETFLAQFPTKEFEDDSEFYWDVVTSARKNIPLIEARKEDGTVITNASPNAGVGGRPIYLLFPEAYFHDGEVIFGNLNQVYPFRILGDAKNEGTNALYKVELMRNHDYGVPAERLLSGERFSAEYAPVEREFSRKVGGIRHSTPVSMRNEWSRVRIYDKQSGARFNEKLIVGIPILKPTADGKMTKTVAATWMHKVDYELEVQFSDYKNNALAFGTSNRSENGEYTNIGKSGGVIQTGAGLFEQMEVSNTHYYNTFSLSLFEDILSSLSTSKIPMNERSFIVKTGEKGAIQFHKEVCKELSGWTQFVIDNVGAVQKTQSNLHPNSLKAGFQFTEYMAPNGVIIKIDVDPMYDDDVRNKIMHPKGGVAYSYRYDIIYAGVKDSPNIFKCAIKGTPEFRGYQWGLAA